MGGTLLWQPQEPGREAQQRGAQMLAPDCFRFNPTSTTDYPVTLGELFNFAEPLPFLQSKDNSIYFLELL